MVRQLKWRFLGIAIPVLLIGGIGWGSDIFIFRKHLQPDLLIRHRIYVHVIWLTYLLAVLVPPGSPPRPISPNAQLAKISTFCRKCNAIKPPRAHHCRICNTCILRMDHHCPWTNNCVGHRNLLHFIRFLLSVVIGTSSVFWNLCGRVRVLWEARHQPIYDDDVSLPEIIATIVFTPVSFFVIFTVGLLTIRTMWNLCENVTLIETWERERVDGQIRRGRLPPVEFPYDLGGPYDNLLAALGPVWRWLLPWTEPPGDGMHFDTNEDADPNTPWPPADPDEIPVYQYVERQMPPIVSNRSSTTGSVSGFPAPYFNERAARSTQLQDGYDTIESEPDDDADPNTYWRRDKWQSWEGERLEDFGVDVDAELYHRRQESDDDIDGDGENVPLGIVKRKLVGIGGRRIEEDIEGRN
ncbi:DHHC palmitoyltransferase-domain-containing protein [Lipomyces tetrasporus]|uniref:Palmitoyltransferase n=1 Tax=Lipomyces tetrasporus TaxID=54092 RepID=A0AAD7QKW6_9ASCO|nr:DHHC palmitoyltransferase-domain-containing protein [Lipomyces tetrasporus]KAJ8096795.1 DHHC palmitoyltransferase-domain-containing protein [Lipomyces tetrasporus]